MSQLEDLLQQCTVKLTLPGRIGWGTGFFVAPGWILTCAHVVQEANSEPVQVWWQKRSLEAVVKRLLPNPYDLALLQIAYPPDVDPPCVYLDEEIRSRDPLYLFGYPDEGDRQGEPRTFNCDGITGSEIASILFNLGQVRPGMSGSPLLNQRTGRVCGIVKFTRDRSIDLGGGAIPTTAILEQLPQLRDLQQEFHGSDKRWSDLVAERSKAPGINQTNLGGRNYQTQTGQNNTNYIGETHIHNYASSPPEAETGARTIDFQPYLRSILNNEDYREWQEVYTPTKVEDRQRLPPVTLAESPQPRFSRRLKLRVETVKPPESEHQRTEATDRQEKVEQLDVLAGLRKYAPEHVLLVGKPGSGKSTSLERLLWEEADQALKQAATAKIPVLVKLRRCTGTIESLMQDFCRSHQLPLPLADIETLLEQGKLLLLLDGLNELPEAFRTTLANFRDRYRATTPMIVSTREQSIGGNLGIAKTLKMLPLTEPQMQEFVRGYLGQEGNRLWQQLKGDRLRKFAETPLLLWMLCRVFAQNDRVPANLGLAFREFTQLYDADLQQDAPAASREQWSKLLRHLAFALMHDRAPTDFRLSMPREEAADLLTTCLQQEGRANARDYAERWLKDLLSYHLIQPVMQPNYEEHIEFRHQLIQEYYAAEYLLRMLPTLSDEHLKREYLNYLKWTEPVALMLAMVEEEAQALRVVQLAMHEVDLILGARLAGEVQPAFQATTVGWIDALEILPLLRCQCWATSQSKVAIPGLLLAIEDQDSNVRKSAAEALGKIGSEAAVAGLLKALEHQNSNVRRSAAEALGKISSVEVIPRLLKALEHQNSNVRRSAAEALGKISTVEVIPGLLKALEDQESYVREDAAEALGKISSVEAIPRLLKALEDQNPNVRGSAAGALGQLGGVEAIAGLLKALENQDSDVHWRVALALSQLGGVEAIAGLLKALEHQDSDVRWSAAYALGQIGSEQAVLGLLKALEQKDFVLRRSASEALGQIGSEQAVLGLLKALEQKDFVLRRSASEALGQIGGEQAVLGLLKALEQKDFVLRNSAASALEQIGSEQAVLGLLKALEHQDFDIRRRASEALGQISSERAVLSLLKALQDQDWAVRRRSAYALGQIGSKQAVLSLLKALQDQDYSVRGSAASALGQIGSEQAVLGLLKALQDQNYSVRGSAASALGQIGSEQAVLGLLKALQDQNYSVRGSAASALGQIGSEQTVLGLLKALQDQNYSVRGSAASALGQIGSEQAVLGLLKALQDQNFYVRRSAAEALAQLGRVEAIPALLKALQDQDFYVRGSAAEALGKIGNSKPLAGLWKQQFISSDTHIYSVISAIQNHCKYYNHEIAHNLLPQGKAIALYFSSAPSDAELQTQLANHLNLLERQEVITSWHHRQMLPGDDRAQVINDRLNSADIILLLISADSIADHTCYDIEINRAMERNQAGEARVIPILLRPVDWTGAPFSQLPVLPKNHQPVTSWGDRDAAFQEIAEGIREVAIELRQMKIES